MKIIVSSFFLFVSLLSFSNDEFESVLNNHLDSCFESKNIDVKSGYQELLNYMKETYKIKSSVLNLSEEVYKKAKKFKKNFSENKELNMVEMIKTAGMARDIYRSTVEKLRTQVIKLKLDKDYNSSIQVYYEFLHLDYWSVRVHKPKYLAYKILTLNNLVKDEKLKEKINFILYSDRICGLNTYKSDNHISEEKHANIIIEIAVKENSEDKDSSYMSDQDVIDSESIEPYFIGGEEGMMRFISNNIVYPQMAVEMGCRGIVYVQYVINNKGFVEKIKIVKSPNDILSKEAIRVVQSMPKWIPGFQLGEPIRVRYTLPLHFRLG